MSQLITYTIMRMTRWYKYILKILKKDKFRDE